MSGDDEQIVVPKNQLKGGRKFIAGITQLVMFKDKSAPVQECDYTVLLQLSGTGPVNDQSGVDIVAVLDVSGSMKDDNKLIDMKIAMRFLINKLRTIDRLSIVSFSNAATEVSRLRQMTPEFKVEAEKLVDDLTANGGTNMHDGLALGIDALRTRKFTEGRTVGIILMSDGEQSLSYFKDVVNVDLFGIPVHTFGFGKNQDPRVMEIVAAKTPGGTYSTVQQDSSLCQAFSTCLAGLLTVIVEDLQLTITPVDATIKDVITGNYKKTTNGDSQIVDFGYLYSKEIRNVLTDLRLPAVSKDEQSTLLKISYSYKVGGKLHQSNALSASVKRTGTSAPPMNEEVKIEKARIRVTGMINKANELALEKKIKEAQEKLDEAQDFLENEFDDPIPPMIKSLKAELKEFMNFLGEKNEYTKEAQAYALSSKISHGIQRHATRGNQELSTYETPTMAKYKEQSKQYEKNTEEPPPSAEEDLKVEQAADPLSEIRGPLKLYIQEAIQALQNIGDILDMGL